MAIIQTKQPFPGAGKQLFSDVKSSVGCGQLPAAPQPGPHPQPRREHLPQLLPLHPRGEPGPGGGPVRPDERPHARLPGGVPDCPTGGHPQGVLRGQSLVVNSMAAVVVF